MTTRNADLLQAAEAATPGPWKSYDSRQDDPTADPPHEVYVPHKGSITYCRDPANARFIALANPSRIRDLVNSEAALVARVSALEAAMVARFAELADGAQGFLNVGGKMLTEQERLEAEQLRDAFARIAEILPRAALARATDPAEGAGG